MSEIEEKDVGNTEELDLLSSLFETPQQVSEKAKIIDKTLASTEKIELFSDLTRNQIYLLTALSMFSDIVNRVYGKRLAFPVDSLKRNILILSVSKEREGRREIVKTIAAEILMRLEGEKKESILKRLLGEG